MFKNIYLTNRFFIIWGIVIGIFILSYSYEGLFNLSIITMFLLGLLTVAESIFLSKIRSSITIKRSVKDQLYMSDVQRINYHLNNKTTSPIIIEIVDELPVQLQHRDMIKTIQLGAQESETFYLLIRPTDRGVYSFGRIYGYVSTVWLGLVQHRLIFNQEKDVAVKPSIIQMKKYELQVFSKTATLAGIRHVRQIGENDEFEHIKMFSQGDHIKSINWKATSRKNSLMVNQYQNSRSQLIYSVLDKGRSMKMPFNNLTLLDYSINSILVLSNIILKKYDKAGLISFSDQIDEIVKAESNAHQLVKISNVLYHQTTGFKESNYERLFYSIRRRISRRSIIFLYTNFETSYDLERNLPYLKAINRNHLLIVVTFINTELIITSEMVCEKKSDIYLQTAAQRGLIEKETIQATLKSHGIQSILTKPEDLSIEIINKYLELKSKRMK